MNDYILEMLGMVKQFPGVLAIDNVDFRVRKGTVHALMGENGAGKSTMMKMLIGLYTPDSGIINFKGEPAEIENTNKALRLGISMIHQELNPVPAMTIAENIWLGREPVNKWKKINHKKMWRDTQKLLQDLNISLNPDTPMNKLSVANQQMVEIAKAISYDAELIIMDEPTSAITESEVEHLFSIIDKLRIDKISIIYITHKMDEVFRIADEITVLRDGQYISTDKAADMDKAMLIARMVGRELNQFFPKRNALIGDVVLKVESFGRDDLFKDVSFELRAGEILGIAGLMGAGRTEIVETLFGIYPKTEGAVHIKGVPADINSPRDAMEHRMALLTENRKDSGLFLCLSVKENITIANINSYLKGMHLDQSAIRRDSYDQVEKLRIKTPGILQQMENLSGGNQQKVLISRWLLTEPDILLLDEPTRGIDVGAKAEIHKLMGLLAEQGKAIVMISSELPEILGMSDRVLVMHEGKQVKILDREEATQERILSLASGEE
ncbi:sugar ABC transporter ATP-binding protein [Marispirochaeta sp.]|uniref:sugar ABC transporter ATP-binding protein n=1 Tax=Marispirochaeta sp. TaxID=2038653 RepID=UPI0029C6DF97|nr:sugar ABC transporter ATP-binding protein [Marispirochaeta sp.]